MFDDTRQNLASNVLQSVGEAAAATMHQLEKRRMMETGIAAVSAALVVPMLPLAWIPAGGLVAALIQVAMTEAEMYELADLWDLECQHDVWKLPTPFQRVQRGLDDIARACNEGWRTGSRDNSVDTLFAMSGLAPAEFAARMATLRDEGFVAVYGRLGDPEATFWLTENGERALRARGTGWRRGQLMEGTEVPRWDVGQGPAGMRDVNGNYRIPIPDPGLKDASAFLGFG